MKTCRDCGEEKPLEEFNRHKRTRDGRNSYCKPCHRSRAKAWQQGPGKEAHAEATKRWKRTPAGALSRLNTERRLRSKWPEKDQARTAVWDAVHSGRLVRPHACESCGFVGGVHGHHHQGYEKAHWLDVVWLCIPCHTAAHRVEVVR